MGVRTWIGSECCGWFEGYDTQHSRGPRGKSLVSGLQRGRSRVEARPTWGRSGPRVWAKGAQCGIYGPPEYNFVALYEARSAKFERFTNLWVIEAFFDKFTASLTSFNLCNEKLLTSTGLVELCIIGWLPTTNPKSIHEAIVAVSSCSHFGTIL